MGVSSRTSLSSLVNSLLAKPQGEAAGTLEDHVRVLGEAVDADAFATFQILPAKGTANILGASGLSTPVDEWQKPVQIPQLANDIATTSDALALALKGPFKNDPFLLREGINSLIIKSAIIGETYLATAALSRSLKTFKRGEMEIFSAAAGVINLVEHLQFLLKEHDTHKGTDKLTGLGLFSDFHQSMVKELSRARRSGGAVTMGIMGVLPRGPDPEENVLLEVARSLKDKLRNFDTLDRYGSMELAFILPDLRSAEGVRVVDRVMGEIISSLGGTVSSPDVFVGLACYPEDGATVERLIEMAEAAMSKAIEESRPGVYRWEENSDR